MPYLNEIIDLRVRAYAGAADGGPINGGVGADLHVVADLHDPGLRHLEAPWTVARVAEAIAADDHARVKNDAVADPATLRHRHVGMQHATTAEPRSRSNGHARHEHGPLSDPGVLSHVAVRIEACVRLNDGGWIDGGQGADARRVYGRGIEQRVDLRESPVGIIDAKKVQRGVRAQVVGHDDRAGLAGGQMGPVARVGQESDVPRAGVLDGRHPLDGHVRVTDHPSSDELGEVRERFA